MSNRSRADDPKAFDALLGSLRDGNFREVACAVAGISQRTLRNWMIWADEAEEGDESKAKWLDVAERIRQAEAHAETESVRIVREGERGVWSAHAWWLERAKQTRWGTKRSNAELAADAAAETAANEDIDEAAVEHVLSKSNLRERVLTGK